MLVGVFSLTSAISLLAPLHSAVSPSPIPQVTVSWSSFTRFTSTSNNDFNPYLIQTLDGWAWLFWEDAPSATPWLQDVYDSIYNGTTWSLPSILAGTASAQDVEPSAAQLSNGTLYLSYSSNKTGNFEIYLRHYSPSTGWSGDFQVSNNPAADVVSSLVAASDGSLWIFWDRQTSTTTNIYYRTFRGGAWSSETALTSDASPVQDQRPAAYQMKDGRIWVAWSQVQNSQQSSIHIVYKTYNGATWSSLVQVTSNSDTDTHPTMTQDSNGTIWMVWTRAVSYNCSGGGCTQDDIFYITSTNNGVSWSSETNLTNDVNCVDPNCFDDDHATITELKDGRIRIFWFSNRDPQNYWDLYYVTSQIIPIHNLAVTLASESPSVLRAGGVATVSVTVANLGTYSETFQISVQETNKTTITIGTRIVSMDPGGSYTYSFSWNTTGAVPGKYSIVASIPAVTNEFFLGDNSMSAGRVWVVPLADVNMDGRVDILDAALVAFSYGSTPGMPNWNTAADLNQDGVVNILDAALVAFWYGTVT